MRDLIWSSRFYITNYFSEI